MRQDRKEWKASLRSRRCPNTAPYFLCTFHPVEPGVRVAGIANFSLPWGRISTDITRPFRDKNPGMPAGIGQQTKTGGTARTHGATLLPG